MTLTREAKAAAIRLADAWDSGELKRRFWISMIQDRAERHYFVSEGGKRSFPLPDVDSLLELYKLGLIDVNRESRQPHTETWEVFLLQELRDGVENNFEIVRTGIHNQVNVTIHGDIYGSLNAALELNIGELNVTNNVEIADEMTSLLGEEFLQTQRELKSAIEELRQASEAERESKLGQVVSEFGRCLGHGANATAVISALVRVSPILVKALGG